MRGGVKSREVRGRGGKRLHLGAVGCWQRPYIRETMHSALNL